MEQHYPNYLPKLLIRIREKSCSIQQLAEREPQPAFIFCMLTVARWLHGPAVRITDIVLCSVGSFVFSQVSLPESRAFCPKKIANF